MIGNRPLRVLHATANLDIGGAQEVVRSLAPALRALGVEASVVTLRDGPLRDNLERAGVPVHVIRGRSRAIVRDPRAIGELFGIRRALVDLVRRLDADIVQTHLLRSLDFLMLTIPKGGHPKVIWTFHNARLDLRPDQLPAGARLLGVKRQAYRSLYHHASRRAAALVAVSSEVAASVRRDLRPVPSRLVTIPNGVAMDRYTDVAGGEAARTAMDLPEGAVLAVCVAKLHEQKGHRVLLDAFDRASRADPRLHLALAGDGPLRAEIAATVEARGLRSRVRLLGERADVPQLLSASDAFILPSLWEGLPMALLEAMASGLPVVASRVSGTEEVLAGGDAGILVEPGDADALTAALLRLAADGALRSSLGAAARSRVAAQYSVEAQARNHEALYRRCLDRGRKAA